MHIFFLILIFYYSQQFEHEKVMTLETLLELNQKMELKLFLLTTNASTKMVECLNDFIKKHEKFVDQIVLCATSPFTVYQVRLTHN